MKAPTFCPNCGIDQCTYPNQDIDTVNPMMYNCGSIYLMDSDGSGEIVAGDCFQSFIDKIYSL